MKVINIFSGPGMGKSTTASGLFYHMKKRGLNCEYVTEYAKDLVWEKQFEVLSEDPLSLLAQQHRRIDRLSDKVDYVITDSPILLAAVYANHYQSGGDRLGEDGLTYYNKLTIELFNKFDNCNLFLMHPKKINYMEEGRTQGVLEASERDEDIFDYLITNKVEFKILEGNEDENLVMALENVIGK